MYNNTCIYSITSDTHSLVGKGQYTIWAGLFPGEAPQKTQITVGLGVEEEDDSIVVDGAVAMVARVCRRYVDGRGRWCKRRREDDPRKRLSSAIYIPLLVLV